MTDDDLRTRAGEAAEAVPVDTMAYYGFQRGFLAHAAQQPTREQIAMLVHAKGGVTEELRPESCRTCRTSLDTADAVLALFDGAGS